MTRTFPRRQLLRELWHWLVSEPIADRYDRTARALADPTYDRDGCYCATGPHHHNACPSQYRSAHCGKWRVADTR